jgi:hypothetical protein
MEMNRPHGNPIKEFQKMENIFVGLGVIKTVRNVRRKRLFFKIKSKNRTKI